MRRPVLVLGGGSWATALALASMAAINTARIGSATTANVSEPPEDAPELSRQQRRHLARQAAKAGRKKGRR